MNALPNILQKIIEHKQHEVAQAIQRKSLKALQIQIDDIEPPKGFVSALQSKAHQQQAAVIAEIKKASPSKGIIRQDFDPIAIANSYEQAGATCISVLTDEQFFKGHLDYLPLIKQHCALPLLRKDFIVDAYQLFESRAAGADCILLIAAALSQEKLFELYHIACSLDLDVLIEIHNKQELMDVLPLNAPMIGINNRDLTTFETSLTTTLDLLSDIPKDTLLITESGIHTQNDVQLMMQNGVYGFLIGESFMRAPDPGKKLLELFGGQ